jgi:hypothetical protein
MIVNCKICNKEFANSTGGALTCSLECRELNKKRIKKEYYVRNTELCIKRSAEQRLNGYKWKPNQEKIEEHKKKRKKRYRIEKLNNPLKFKVLYDKVNNTEKRKQYMKDYILRPGQKEKEKERRDKYRSKPSTKEIRHTDHYKRRYGITVQDYDMMHMEQNGLCKICNNPESRVSNGKTSRLAVDHCHNTGKVRGLLCWACNASLGRFKDSIEILESAISYLKKNQIS